MKNIVGFLRTLIGIILLIALISGMVAILQGLRVTTPSSPLPSTSTPELAYPPADLATPVETWSSLAYPWPGVPTPDWNAIGSATPEPTLEVLPPGEYGSSDLGTVFPTLGPPVILTSAPDVPTPTPFPLRLPAADASGRLFYLTIQENRFSQLSFVDVNGSGLVDVPASSLVGDLPQGRMYPSPDGRYLVIVGDWEVSTLVDLETGQVESLSGKLGFQIEGFFGWHPDSRQVLLASGGGLRLVNVETGSVVRLVSTIESGGVIDGGAVSPDGQQVVYSFYGGYATGVNATEVWLISIDGRAATLILKSDIYQAWNFSWSPDGKQVAFYFDGLYLMNADGTNLRKVNGITALLSQCYIAPLWSPDSQMLAVVPQQENATFCNARSEAVFQGTDINLVDVAGGEAHPLLADGILGNIDPTWSPNGKQLAFVSNRGGSPEVWIVQVDGSSLRQVTELGGLYVRWPFWQRP